MAYGKLYLIPTSLRGKPLADELSAGNIEIVSGIKHFVVETPKIGRSFLQGLNLTIRDLTFYELNENSDDGVINSVLSALTTGNNVGVISDAGAPGVGDMGTKLVYQAHKNGLTVIPLVGPSAILLSLMSSGLNGQSFAFNGYLPKDQDKRIKTIKNLENSSERLKQSQAFIETPYRAQYVLEDLVRNCKDTTLLSISVNLTHEEGYSKTRFIKDWRKDLPNLNKKQVVFIIQG